MKEDELGSETKELIAETRDALLLLENELASFELQILLKDQHDEKGVSFEK